MADLSFHAEKSMEDDSKKGYDEPTKVFIGQIPRTVEEADIRALFEQYGQVKDVAVIRDKGTGAHRGCAFVSFATRAAADKVIALVHDKIQLPGAKKALQCSIATKVEHEYKLFVGRLPKDMDEQGLSQIFERHGPVKEVYIMREPGTNNSKGVAFVKFTNKRDALSAIENLNEKVILQGATGKLIVKFAETKEAKFNKQATNMASNLYGLNPLNLTFAAYAANNPFFSQNPASGNGLNSGLGHQPAMGAPDMGFGNPAFSLMQHNQSSVQPNSFFSPQLQQPGPAKRGAAESRGPPGANIFVYNVPSFFGDMELASLFSPFGRILSSTIFREKSTGVSRGFGFISYYDADAASAAIAAMNGFQIDDRKLKVQLKTPGKNQQQSGYYQA